jgi:hypothetical protein
MPMVNRIVATNYFRWGKVELWNFLRPKEEKGG